MAQSGRICRESTVSAWILAGFLALAASAASAQSTPPPSREAGMLALALTEAASGNWDRAQTMVSSSGAVAQRLITWQALREGQGDFPELLAFLDQHGHWPLINTVQRRAEALLPDRSPSEILSFFENRTPLTEDGHIALALALRNLNRADDATDMAREIWVSMPLSPPAEAQLNNAFGASLRALDAARVDMLLWAGDRQGAQRHLARLDDGQQRLARARIALQERAPGVDALVAAVPDALSQDPGLMRDRFEFRMRAGNYPGAGDLLLAQSRHPAGLGLPDAWGGRRVFLVRTAMSDGDFQRAYDLATPHGLEDGLHFVDLEFLAGFIALVHLDRPETALGHFRALRVRVNSPISLGRAGYWEGRAHEALNDPISAQAAYEFAAEHQTSYYGQLAADRLGLSLDPALVATPDYPHWRDTDLAQSDLLEAALLLREAGQWHEARRFVLFLARQLETEAQLGALADLMLALDEPNFALNVAKIAVQSEIVLTRAYFPVTALAQAQFDVPMDLIKAIARRESEFDAAVVSPADARGLMQVLPGTGQMMARKLGVPFQPADLTGNPELNARLGAAYLDELRAEFGPSLALVAAGYNAGPGRPRQWTDRLGDPRDPSVDFVTWVESVPFAETRNYIMRVAESLVVYRSVLAGESRPIDMEALIRGR
ncbi:lytic transglycosylase domain-containing protein [Roseinatronobacter alkalisoli]|uniref:Lytic transglycosylase domain-containing protein n=1 Tax=Roseinatronobacter alkalisoli TaxID=3028235 RepID=A0ABT5TAU3_9RHOB|nr:lytic transglycosylase domain-containing protein [Roseinatronobacter sp. HJB301]MDD7972064.1 lytic transglycosylase domain-containing protein [Roseinatronobacter sp. HJB301]